MDLNCKERDDVGNTRYTASNPMDSTKPKYGTIFDVNKPINIQNIHKT